MTALERFKAKVDCTPASGCFLWTGAKNQKGYGRFLYNGRNRYAHNVIWEITFGPIPEGRMVCHKCDNPSCVNETHLFLGTALDNVRDMISKQRGNYISGEFHPKAKLRPADVDLVLNSTIPTARLAERFGVTYKAIDFIRKGINWRRV